MSEPTHSPVCPVICCGPTGDDAHDALAIMAEPWMHECGSCDAALPMSCTCPPSDPRLVIDHLWTAYEALWMASRG